MTEVTPDTIRQFFEQASKAYGDAWKVQAEYYDRLARHNMKAFTELADARLASFREMRDAQTFNQAFEANLAFEEKVREELAGLQEANTKSWEKLVSDLKGIYTPDREAPKKAPARKAAKAKSPAKKAAPAKAKPKARAA